MCGIAGFITNDSLGRKEAEKVILEMCLSIKHRGPDDYGTYFEGFDKEDPLKVVFGHNRLSIIDLSKFAHQPMTNEDGSIWVTYNGEIYNFLELRQVLAQKGHKFISKCDTEVIIHGYEEWGEECLQRFNGMFAFAIWDNKKRSLFLARDRMGKKPLYYTQFGGNFVFASEPKAILKYPKFNRRLDRLSLQKYLLYEYVPSPSTIYENIKRLDAGNFILFNEDKAIIQKRYWSLDFNKKKYADTSSQLKSDLKSSVKNRLISDVPLGVFLSGGIDSSAITYLMSELKPSKDIKTFTIGFEDKSFDEALYARQLAEMFHTDHHEKILDPKAMLRIIPEIANFLDEPLADASIIPTYLLSKFTKEYVTVALGGDGGDELFAGYETFQAHKIANIYKKLPAFLRGFFYQAFLKLPVSLNNMSLDFKLKQFLRGIEFDLPARNQAWLGSFLPVEQKSLILEPDLKNGELFRDIEDSLKDCNAKNYIDLLTYLYCKFYLADDILTKVDRASMANSLEVRAPFLDYKFVEFALSLDPYSKLHNFESKYILKRSLKNDLPHKIISRSKKGFGIPIGKWINSDLKDLFMDTLSTDKIKREGNFDSEYIQNLLEEHHDLTKDNRKKLWTLFIFELWHDNWLKKT